MAGYLTEYLEEGFERHCPSGWVCRREGHLLKDEDARFLGYSPRADVVLEQEGGKRRIWVEFEVSRADPVANHAKFATAQHLGFLNPGDVFLSMISAHVARGRRNLASNMVGVMRLLGLDAFQTVLFPRVDGPGIFRLNHAEREWLRENGPDVSPELERVLNVCSPVWNQQGHRIHYASDPFEVMLNVRAWNAELEAIHGRKLWGKRRVEYFVYDPSSGLFAPSKFCAFVPLPAACVPRAAFPIAMGDVTMTVALYASLDESESRFDGRIAWKHICERLAFSAVRLRTNRELSARFEAWAMENRESLRTAGPQTKVLLPPFWFMG